MTDRASMWMGVGVLAMFVAACGSPSSPGAPGKPGTNAVTIHIPGMEEQLKLR